MTEIKHLSITSAIINVILLCFTLFIISYMVGVYIIRTESTNGTIHLSRATLNVALEMCSPNGGLLSMHVGIAQTKVTCHKYDSND